MREISVKLNELILLCRSNVYSNQ